MVDRGEVHCRTGYKRCRLSHVNHGDPGPGRCEGGTHSYQRVDMPGRWRRNDRDMSPSKGHVRIAFHRHGVNYRLLSAIASGDSSITLPDDSVGRVRLAVPLASASALADGPLFASDATSR